MCNEENSKDAETNEGPGCWETLRDWLGKEGFSIVARALNVGILVVAVFFVCLIFRNHEGMFQTLLSWPVMGLVALLVFRKGVRSVFDAAADRVKAMKMLAAEGRSGRVAAIFEHAMGDFDDKLEQHQAARTTTRPAVVDVDVADARVKKNAKFGFVLGSLAEAGPRHLLGILQSVRTGTCTRPPSIAATPAWMLLCRDGVIVRGDDGLFKFDEEARPLVETTLDLLEKYLYQSYQASARGAYSVEGSAAPE